MTAPDIPAVSREAQAPLRTVGLLGGMSSHSTIDYYRLIDAEVNAKVGGYTSAPLLIRSVNFGDIHRCIHGGDWAEAGQLLAAAGRELQAGGARAVFLCTNTMHRVADALDAALDVPLVHIVDVVARSLKAEGFHRPALLGSRAVTTDEVFRRRYAGHGVDPVRADEADVQRLDEIVFDELCRGRVLPASRDQMRAIIDRLAARGADAVVLGCTEFRLLMEDCALPLPSFDSTTLHARAAAAFCLGESAAK